MNKKHIQNLLKLADFLETKITDKQFDMSSYRTDEYGTYYCQFKGLNDCGTIGCALGWAPWILSKRKLKQLMEYSCCFDFFENLANELFGERFFDSNEFSYLFDGYYSESKYSTRKDAVKRLRRLASGKNIKNTREYKMLDELGCFD